MSYHRLVRCLFIVDPLDRLALAGDTSYALMLEAAARGWDVWTCQIEHLGLRGDDAVADACPTIVTPATTPADAFQVEQRAHKRLADFDVVLMRKDPPVDVNYLHATWILDHARGKTLLVNDPRGLRELNEHLAVLHFPALTPPTIVTRSADQLREFQREQGGAIVVKPVDGVTAWRQDVASDFIAEVEDVAQQHLLLGVQDARLAALLDDDFQFLDRVNRLMLAAGRESQEANDGVADAVHERDEGAEDAGEDE